ncbi:hypothetical protein HU200_050174 [Digitaria exilis]|uniref:Uncharacterized protein n=1 Tax=Digitaria exilis TaxID=1010633 RepID=A0A835ART6_9POAL|nr:hypothetical protein HU200_050174 [Digitaria exilis]
MAASWLAVAVVVVAAAALPMLAAGGYTECYDFCFKDCISKDKSMRDYCSYACDKTCAPDAPIRRRTEPAMECQIGCVRKSCHGGIRADGKDMEACYGQCYNSCETGTVLPLPRPLRAGSGPVRPAALPDHPFHKKQDAFRPAALPDHPFHEKQDVWPAALPDHPFHEKHDAVVP